MKTPYFTIHQIPGRIGNITIIEYPDKLLLIDTGSKKDYTLPVKTLILPHGGIAPIDDITAVIAALFSEVYQKMPFPIGLLRPFTKLSPEIRKAGPYT